MMTIRNPDEQPATPSGGSAPARDARVPIAEVPSDGPTVATAHGAASGERVMVADLYRMLDTLSTEERLAWTLRHLEGEQLERVAELCGCSLATAKRRIAAAHAVMGGELGDA